MKHLIPILLLIISFSYAKSNIPKELLLPKENECLCSGSEFDIVAKTYDTGIKAYYDKDYDKAFSYLVKACEYRYNLACGLVGDLYYDGKGVAQDKLLSLEYYQKSCNLGLKEACDAYDLAIEAIKNETK